VPLPQRMPLVITIAQSTLRHAQHALTLKTVAFLRALRCSLLKMAHSWVRVAPRGVQSQCCVRWRLRRLKLYCG